MAVLNINEMFRNISNLDTGDISDADLQATYIPLAEKVVNKLCRQEYTISDYTAATTDAATAIRLVVDRIIALVASHHAWESHRFNFTEGDVDDFYVYDRYLQNAYALMFTLYDDVVEFNDNRGRWQPSDKHHDTPTACMTTIVGDSTKVGGYRSVTDSEAVEDGDF